MTTFDWSARWTATWRALSARPFDGEQEMLLQRYDAPARHYHTRQHLEECFVRWDQVRSRAAEPAAAEIALWYHDAVYDTHRADNEAQSADLAAVALTTAGVKAATVGRVQELIMATTHAAPPGSPDAALVVDVDLGILAATAERFDEYEQQVREEYAWVPGILFRKKRADVLRGFLGRERIFSSGAFDADEARARENLTRSLARL